MKKWKPKRGQIDFTHARFAPVINCVLKYRDKMLIVQRNQKLNLYPGYWNGISGFLDDCQTLEQKVQEELHEELGISTKNIASIQLGDIFHQAAPKYKKVWIVHPILVKVKTDKIRLDGEASRFEWIKIQDVDKYKLLPGFNTVLKKISKLL